MRGQQREAVSANEQERAPERDLIITRTKQVEFYAKTVGVAIANVTCAAARRIARFAALLARNAFPTLDMYRPS